PRRSAPRSGNVSPDPRLNGDSRAIRGDTVPVLRLGGADRRAEILTEPLIGGDGTGDGPALIGKAGDDDRGGRRRRDAHALAVAGILPLQRRVGAEYARERK